MHANKANKIQVSQKDPVSPLQTVMSVGCHCHLLHAELWCYLGFLPLLLAVNKTLHLLFGSFLSFFFFLLYSVHNSEMLFKIKQPFSSKMLQSFLFVCVFALAQCMNIDKTNCAVQWSWGFFTHLSPIYLIHKHVKYCQTQVSKLILGAVSFV